MEDINLGRETRCEMLYFTVGAASQKLLDYDPFRVALIITSPPSGSVTYAHSSQANQGLGWHMPNGSKPFAIGIRDFGEAVKKELWALGDAATRRISVTVVTLARTGDGA